MGNPPPPQMPARPPEYRVRIDSADTQPLRPKPVAPPRPGPDYNLINRGSEDRPGLLARILRGWFE